MSRKVSLTTCQYNRVAYLLLPDKSHRTCTSWSLLVMVDRITKTIFYKRKKSRCLTVDDDVDLLANCFPVGHLHVVLAEPLEVASGALVRHPGRLLPIIGLLHVLLLHRLRHLEPGAAEGKLAMFRTYWYFETFFVLETFIEMKKALQHWDELYVWRKWSH